MSSNIQIFVRDVPGCPRSQSIVLSLPYDSKVQDVENAIYRRYHERGYGCRDLDFRLAYQGHILTDTLLAHDVEKDSTLYCVGVKCRRPKRTNGMPQFHCDHPFRTSSYPLNLITPTAPTPARAVPRLASKPDVDVVKTEAEPVKGAKHDVPSHTARSSGYAEQPPAEEHLPTYEELYPEHRDADTTTAVTNAPTTQRARSNQSPYYHTFVNASAARVRTGARASWRERFSDLF